MKANKGEALLPVLCAVCQVPWQLVFGLAWSFKHKRMVMQHVQCPQCLASLPIMFTDGDLLERYKPFKTKPKKKKGHSEGIVNAQP